MRRHRRGRLLLLAVLLSVSVTGCGVNSGVSSSHSTGSNGYDFSINSGTSSKNEISNVTDSVGFDSFAGVQSTEGGNTGFSGSVEHIATDVPSSLKKEMLVYTCCLSIDTLSFDDSVNGLKVKLNESGGFIENEEYSNGRSGGYYYRGDEDIFRSYRAMVRVTSAQYNEFVDGVSAFGDVRRKDAYVENVSQEYHDIRTTLEIYEAKQERYINLLKTITEDSYAIEVERELTNIQVEIARLKTRMITIETDVAYSYIDVSIQEVKEYRVQPVKKDTFLQRLRNTVVETVEGFMLFLEGALFFVIGVTPYVVVLLLIFLISRPLRRRLKVERLGAVKGYLGSRRASLPRSGVNAESKGDGSVSNDTDAPKGTE